MKKFFNIKNKCGMDLSQTEELFHDLGGFAQKRFGFKKPPTLHLISDGENASKPLGKTAYYDPQGMAITIYTDNRHTKDILRSLAHELVHHMQNENGMLNDSGYHGQGYAQKNKNLRHSEKEAYLKGNMCFRDWEDTLKQTKPTIYNEWRIKTMSTKKWKNNELMENLSEKFGFKMNLSLLKEAKEELEVEDGPGTGDENMGITKDGKMVPNPGGDGKNSKKKDKKTKEMKEEKMGDNPEGVTELFDAINNLSEKESDKLFSMLKRKKEEKKNLKESTQHSNDVATAYKIFMKIFGGQPTYEPFKGEIIDMEPTILKTLSFFEQSYSQVPTYYQESIHDIKDKLKYDQFAIQALDAALDQLDASSSEDFKNLMGFLGQTSTEPIGTQNQYGGTMQKSYRVFNRNKASEAFLIALKNLIKKSV